ncbi:MAG: hypothetical protein V4819_07905 [Verrucomicrobiota bacterium]
MIRLNDKLLCCGAEITQVWKFRHHGKNIFSVTEPIRTQKAFVWMIDAEGCYREFIELSRPRKTPNFLKWLIDFTRIEYEITPPRRITIAELRKVLKGAKVHRRALLRAVSPLKDDDVLDQKTFLQDFMNEPETVTFTPFPDPRPQKSR